MATFKQMIQELTDKFIKTQPLPASGAEAMKAVAEKAKAEAEKIKTAKKG